MSCEICGLSSCASWMHSPTAVAAWDSVSGLSERELKLEVIDLRAQVKDLENRIEELEYNRE